MYALWAVFGVLEPLYVRDVLHASDDTFALLQTVFGVGLVVTGLLLAVLGDRIARPRYVAIAMIVSGATAALYLGTESKTIAFIGVFLWGVDTAFFYVPARTLLQRYTPARFHGRVLSLDQSLEPAAGIVMTPLAALALGVVSVRTLGVAAGALATVGGVALFLVGRHLATPPPSGLDEHAGTSPRRDTRSVAQRPADDVLLVGVLGEARRVPRRSSSCGSWPRRRACARTTSC